LLDHMIILCLIFKAMFLKIIIVYDLGE
jgi:hypothetical protein